jgi:hypothetical protein
MDWSLKHSNLRNISKSINKTSILLGQLQMLQELLSDVNNETYLEQKLCMWQVIYMHCAYWKYNKYLCKFCKFLRITLP